MSICRAARPGGPACAACRACSAASRGTQTAIGRLQSQTQGHSLSHAEPAKPPGLLRCPLHSSSVSRWLSRHTAARGNFICTQKLESFGLAAFAAPQRRADWQQARGERPTLQAAWKRVHWTAQSHGSDLAASCMGAPSSGGPPSLRRLLSLPATAGLSWHVKTNVLQLVMQGRTLWRRQQQHAAQTDQPNPSAGAPPRSSPAPLLPAVLALSRTAWCRQLLHGLPFSSTCARWRRWACCCLPVRSRLLLS